MTTKAKRRPAAQKVDFYWFQGASVAALRERLAGAGANPRLEVRLSGEKMTLDVIPDGATIEAGSPSRLPPINESHACPPQCP